MHDNTQCEEPHSKLRGSSKEKSEWGYQPHTPLAIHPYSKLQSIQAFSHNIRGGT